MLLLGGPAAGDSRSVTDNHLLQRIKLRYWRSVELMLVNQEQTGKVTCVLVLIRSSLPELLEKKRLIDLHTNVATAVLDHIKVRRRHRPISHHMYNGNI